MPGLHPRPIQWATDHDDAIPLPTHHAGDAFEDELPRRTPNMSGPARTTKQDGVSPCSTPR
jgi:hypothetical protein